MTTDITSCRRWPALALGAFFAGVTGYVLLKDVFDGAPVATAHVLAVAALVAAIASGHGAWPALRSGAVVPGLMLVALFLGSTAYVVVSSGARNAEASGNKTARIEANNQAREREQKLLARAETMLAEAQAKLAVECASGKGKRCDGVKATVDVYEAAIRGHKQALKDLAPPADAHGGYAHAAKVLVATGVPGTAAAIEERLTLLLPFVTALIAELGTIAFLHLGLGHREQPASPAPAPIAPTPKRKSRRGATEKDTKVVAFVDAFRRRHGRDPSIRELQGAFAGMPSSTAQRYRKQGSKLGQVITLRVA